MSSEPVIVARDLSRAYGAMVAVDGIDFTIERGECFGFLGPNGAGKTTTMRMIYRASPVGSGSLRVFGLEASGGDNDRAIKRRLGVVAQEDTLDQEVSVRENLEVFARFFGLGRHQARQRIDALLDDLQLTAKASSRVLELSGGLRRRTQIARGLLGEPELLVLDEPTTGLDPHARQDLWQRLGALQRRHATLLLTTHYMEEAEKLCDRLVVMDHGKVVASGSPSALLAQWVPSHVVEVSLDGDGVVPAGLEEMTAQVERHEVLSDRLLLYVDHGEDLLRAVATRAPGRAASVRRSTLEDVFLSITGRRLEE